MNATARQQRHLEAALHLVNMARALADQAARVESALTFAPPEDRDLRAVARGIVTAHQELQVELATYLLQYGPRERTEA